MAQEGQETTAALKKALELPVFKGDESEDQMTGQDFITRVDFAQKIGEWSNENTARYVCLRLRGKAWAWISGAISEEQPWVSTWTQLKKEFTQRWVPSKTVSEKVALRHSLMQKGDETVLDFYDRVKKAEQVFQYSTVPVPEAQKAARQIVVDTNILFNFFLCAVATLSPLK